MAIQSLIIHHIERWQEEQPATLKLRDSANLVSADYEALFSQLKKVFQFKAGKLFGRFEESVGDFPFSAWLKDQQAGRSTFESLVARYMEHFKSLVDKTSESFEAYVVTLLEDRADGPRLYLFVLDTQSHMRIDHELNLEPVDTLNTGKLDYALRIELDELENNEQESPYLCMVRSRGQAKLGEAFTQSVGFKNSVDTQQETETLMEILANYTQRAEPKEAAAVRQKAYDFCVEQQQLGEAVPLNELSGYLDENQPTRFAEFAEQEAHIDAQRQLRPDTRKLKHLVRLSGKGNGLSLSFSSDLIQQTILFDEKSDTLTITSIPKTLKKQILEHLKEQQNED